MKKLTFFILCALLTAALGGCVDISGRKLPASSHASATTTAPPDEPKTVSVTTTAEPESETSPFITTGEGSGTEFSEEYGTFILSDEDKEFLSHCVFVGDSICSGLRNYGILPAEQIAAQGNIAARNIFDFTFTKDGAEVSLLPLLVDLRPDNIIFSMGMNDVNITTTQEFADNYKDLLLTVEGFLPNAKLFVLSVTPVTAESTFTANENIDNFNAELERMIGENEKWTYVDITPEMKNSENAMKTDYDGGDGVHLAPEAYDAILWQLCRAAMPDEPRQEDV